jgi:hypothetical protein
LRKIFRWNADAFVLNAQNGEASHTFKLKPNFASFRRVFDSVREQIGKNLSQQFFIKAGISAVASRRKGNAYGGVRRWL